MDWASVPGRKFRSESEGIGSAFAPSESKKRPEIHSAVRMRTVSQRSRGAWLRRPGRRSQAPRLRCETVRIRTALWISGLFLLSEGAKADPIPSLSLRNFRPGTDAQSILYL